jgi:hypothetical protein
MRTSLEWTKKTKKSPSLPPSPKKPKRKKLSINSVLGHMKFLFPKQLVTFSSRTNYRFGAHIVKVDSFGTTI